MNNSPPSSHEPRRRHAPGARRQEALRRPSPLTDDQYLATSLALVADLSRRVRGGKFCRTGVQSS